jgi:hypothetical protein
MGAVARAAWHVSRTGRRHTFAKGVDVMKRAWIGIGLLGVLAGCSGGEPDNSAVGSAEASIKSVPNNVACVQIIASAGRTTVSNTDVTPGQAATIRLSNLSVGNVTFSAFAFQNACAAASGTQATWASDSTVATILPGQLTNLTLTLVQAGGANVGIDFDQDGSFGPNDLGTGTPSPDQGPDLASPPSPFQDPVNYSFGASVTGIAIADVNSDGKPDIVGTLGSSKVGVLLGYTNGFALAGSYSTGSGPYGVVSGDFNGDGKLDLATVNINAYTVSVLLGTGGGSFAAAVSYTTSFQPIDLVAGDLNGDGKLDLAASSPGADGSGIVNVYLGVGNGSFQPAVAYPTGHGARTMGLGDFNKDGKLDLACAASSGVNVLLGNGNGSFGPAIFYATDHSVTALAVADLNSDGKLDFAALATDNLATAANHSVNVFLGIGNGTFQSPVAYAAGNYPLGLASGDFDGDGKLDVVTCDLSASSATVLLLPGNGNGTFQPAFAAASVKDCIDLKSGDLNGDGKLDLTVANPSGLSATVLLRK